MHKTKQAALKAARTEMGDDVVEGIDFNLKNTGAGWAFEPIPPGNEAAAAAQGKRVRASKPPKSVKAKAPKNASTAKPNTGQSKSEMLMEMLKGAGSTSKEMEAAAGWQPHSVRGFLGTLRKKGVAVVSKKLPGEPTIYRIGKAVAKADEQIGDVV